MKRQAPALHIESNTVSCIIWINFHCREAVSASRLYAVTFTDSRVCPRRCFKEQCRLRAASNKAGPATVRSQHLHQLRNNRLQQAKLQGAKQGIAVSAPIAGCFRGFEQRNLTTRMIDAYSRTDQQLVRSGQYLSELQRKTRRRPVRLILG